MTKNIKAKNKKVLVAMSGGVDSSVAAALLKKEGFLVAGAFMRCWQDFNRSGCQASDDELMARMAAEKLGIPFYVFDFIKEYKKRVFDYFVKEYKAGRTPNPDVMCNREIKFGLFFDEAMRLGFDFIATGHYARVRRGKDEARILKGKDRNKDQSYFLYAVKKDRLNKVLFPVGDYLKSEVRAMARKFRLPNAERKDSQGICFVGKVKLEDFLKDYIKPKQGSIVDRTGKALGKHQGLSFYTIGQRKGIRLPGGPFYVVAKDFDRNILIVSKNEVNLEKKGLIAENLNWITPINLKSPLAIEARIRYRQPVASAKIKKNGNGKVKLVFNKAQRAITSGQSVVFYKKEEMLGGGVII